MIIALATDFSVRVFYGGPPFSIRCVLCCFNSGTIHPSFIHSNNRLPQFLFTFYSAVSKRGIQRAHTLYMFKCLYKRVKTLPTDISRVLTSCGIVKCGSVRIITAPLLMVSSDNAVIEAPGPPHNSQFFRPSLKSLCFPRRTQSHIFVPSFHPSRIFEAR